MTSIGYKDSYKKFSWVTNAIKILALKRWIRCNDVSQAMLVTDDKKLSNSLSKLFDSENIDFDSIVHGCNFSNITLWKLVYQKIPSFLRAIIWFLFYIVKRWRIVVSKRLEVDAADTDIVFISYLDNIVGCVNSPESFNSSYWGEVPNVLNMNGCKAVWAHFYVDSYSLSVKDAISLTSKYNRLDGLQSHFMLDSFVSFRVLFRTVIDWLYLIRRAKAVKKMIESSTIAVPFWDLLSDEWRDSVSGPVSISNVFYANLFDELVSFFSTCRLGVYLQENSRWEAAFLCAWRNLCSGRVVGVRHTPARYWDLKNYFYYKNYGVKEGGGFLPDMMAVNGRGSEEMFYKAGYPAENIVVVEAIRYLYLDGIGRKDRHQDGKLCETKILVLGDYVRSYAEMQMEMLNDLRYSLPNDVAVVVKPHPNCMIRKCDYPELDFELTNAQLSEVIIDFDIAIVGASTSAAIDAYVLGLYVISVMDLTSLNLSPLCGADNVSFVSNSGQLLESILNAKLIDDVSVFNENYFCIDNDLYRWKKVLGFRED